MVVWRREKKGKFCFFVSSIKGAMPDWKLEVTFLMQLSKQGSQVSLQQAPEEWWCSLIGCGVTLWNQQLRSDEWLDGAQIRGDRWSNIHSAEIYAWIFCITALKKPTTFFDFVFVAGMGEGSRLFRQCVKSSYCLLFQAENNTVAYMFVEHQEKITVLLSTGISLLAHLQRLWRKEMDDWLYKLLLGSYLVRADQ